MSLDEPPTVLFIALYLAWFALRASALRFFSATAAALAFAAAALLASASFFAFAFAASAFLRSASCFAFIALRRASVSMVLPARTVTPRAALALNADCLSAAGATSWEVRAVVANIFRT